MQATLTASHLTEYFIRNGYEAELFHGKRLETRTSHKSFPEETTKASFRSGRAACSYVCNSVTSWQTKLRKTDDKPPVFSKIEITNVIT